MESDEMLLERIKPYKEHMESFQTWNSFKKNNTHLDLPHGNTLINRFESWNQAKQLVNELSLHKKWTVNELEEVLLRHKKGLKGTARDWDEYKKQLNESLPSATTIINNYNSWNEVKRAFGLPEQPTARPQKYTNEELIQIAKEHVQYTFSNKTWTNYKKGKDLPTYSTLINRIRVELKSIQKAYKEKLNERLQK